LIALLLNGTGDIKSTIAAGATFGPTSLGIALNILRGGGILNTPVGQLIISAAVIDDMIALIILSQLESLTGTITAASVLIPIISAVAFLGIGGYVALYVLPPVINKHVLVKFDEVSHGKVEMTIMIGMLIVMMPATFYAKASYLLGAFVAGLTFCTSHELHLAFVRQFKRLMQWLMRIFFAASIGFQVPIKDFANGTVVWQGIVFTLALLGKLAVGFMVPNFTQSRNFSGLHLRDCLITGFSMAAEGEFAFVIAVFSVDEGLIDKDLYASVVLAILMSTILPPFLLRFTISYYNKAAEATVRRLAEQEMKNNHDLENPSLTETDRNEMLAGDIRNERVVFLCVQTQSNARWGLMHDLMRVMADLGLDVIDHRAWHPRGIDTTLVNEVYLKDNIAMDGGSTMQSILDKRIEEVTAALEMCINQPEGSKVKVQRWYPGVVEEITEKVDQESKTIGSNSISLEQRLLCEATKALDQRQSIQLAATQEKTVEEILAGMKSSGIAQPEEAKAEGGASPRASTRRASRRRQKMRSTPVVGGGLFGETTPSETHADTSTKEHKGHPTSKQWQPTFNFGKRTGIRAEIIVDGESYNVRISNDTVRSLRSGFSGDMLDTHGMSVDGTDSRNVVNNLQGYVRSQMNLGKITEEDDEHESETSSLSAAQKK